MVKEWMLKNNFYWELASVLPKTTTDPKRLAYVRLALKDIFEAIRHQYKRVNRELYIVAEVSEEEKAKLEKAQNKFILFSGFVKGYFNEKDARAMVKGKSHLYMFTVEQFRGIKDDELDFGYFVHKDSGSVYYNIYNVFQVT